MKIASIPFDPQSQVVEILRRSTNWSFRLCVIALLVVPFALSELALNTVQVLAAHIGADIDLAADLSASLALSLILMGMEALGIWLLGVREQSSLRKLASLSRCPPIISEYAQSIGIQADAFAFGTIKSLRMDARVGLRGSFPVLIVTTGLLALGPRLGAGFKAIILHEFAHIQAKDVQKTSFVRRAFAVLICGILLPAFVLQLLALILFVIDPAEAFTADHTTIPVVYATVHIAFLTLAFGVMSFGLMLIYSSTVRYRESMADLQASSWDGAGGLIELIRPHVESTLSVLSRLKKAIAPHPSPLDRVHRLESPLRALAPDFPFLFANGFLFGFTSIGSIYIIGLVGAVSAGVPDLAPQTMDQDFEKLFDPTMPWYASVVLFFAIFQPALIGCLIALLAALCFEAEKCALRSLLEDSKVRQPFRYLVRVSIYWASGLILSPLAFPTAPIYLSFFALEGWIGSEDGRWLYLSTFFVLIVILTTLGLLIAYFALSHLGRKAMRDSKWVSTGDRMSLVPGLLVWSIGPGQFLMILLVLGWSAPYDYVRDALDDGAIVQLVMMTMTLAITFCTVCFRGRRRRPSVVI